LAALGRTDEALEAIRPARVLEPLSPLVHAGAALVLCRLQIFDEARSAAEASLELDPSFVLAHWILGWIHQHYGRHAEAREALERAVNLSGRSSLMLSALGVVCAKAGKRTEAESIAAELEARATSVLFPGLVRWQLGQEERAFELLEQAVRERNIWVITIGPGFPDLVSHPRWRTLLERAGLGPLTVQPATK
jgi:tetratricopeptide (TPR) repeat protein